MKLTPTQARNMIRKELDKGNGIYIGSRFFDVRVKAGVLQVSDFNSWFDVPTGSVFRNGHGRDMFTYELDASYKRLQVVTAHIANGSSWAGSPWVETFQVGAVVEVLRETATQYVISPMGFELKVSKDTGLLAGYKGSKHRVEFEVVQTPLKPFVSGKWHAWQGTAQVMLSDESVKQLREFSNVTDCINWLFTNDQKEAARALNAHVKAGV